MVLKKDSPEEMAERDSPVRKALCSECSRSSSQNVLEQWVKTVPNFSSEYSTGGSYSASNVCGPPTMFPNFGDSASVWCPRLLNNQQYLELDYEEAVFIRKIEIYETWYAGGVHKISSKDKSGQWLVLWQADRASDIGHSRIFSPDLVVPKGLKSSSIRLDIDCTISGSWVEIDAVKLTGKKQSSEPTGTIPTLNDLATDLGQMLQRSWFQDIQFKVEDAVIPAHKAVLVARCPYFHSTLWKEGPPEENLKQPVEIDKISETCFRGVLQYIYTNQLNEDIKPFDLVEVIRASSRFRLPGLERLCLSYLSDEIAVANVVDVFKAASEEPKLNAVCELCLDFIADNMEDVYKESAFATLCKELMLEVVQKAAERVTPASAKKKK